MSPRVRQWGVLSLAVLGLGACRDFGGWGTDTPPEVALPGEEGRSVHELVAFLSPALTADMATPPPVGRLLEVVLEAEAPHGLAAVELACRDRQLASWRPAGEGRQRVSAQVDLLPCRTGETADGQRERVELTVALVDTLGVRLEAVGYPLLVDFADDSLPGGGGTPVRAPRLTLSMPARVRPGGPVALGVTSDVALAELEVQVGAQAAQVTPEEGTPNTWRATVAAAPRLEGPPDTVELEVPVRVFARGVSGLATQSEAALRVSRILWSRVLPAGFFIPWSESGTPTGVSWTPVATAKGLHLALPDNTQPWSTPLFIPALLDAESGALHVRLPSTPDGKRPLRAVGFTATGRALLAPPDEWQTQSTSLFFEKEPAASEVLDLGVSEEPWDLPGRLQRFGADGLCLDRWDWSVDACTLDSALSLICYTGADGRTSRTIPFTGPDAANRVGRRASGPAFMSLANDTLFAGWGYSGLFCNSVSEAPPQLVLARQDSMVLADPLEGAWGAWLLPSGPDHVVVGESQYLDNGQMLTRLLRVDAKGQQVEPYFSGDAKLPGSVEQLGHERLLASRADGALVTVSFDSAPLTARLSLWRPGADSPELAVPLEGVFLETGKVLAAQGSFLSASLSTVPGGLPSVDAPKQGLVFVLSQPSASRSLVVSVDARLTPLWTLSIPSVGSSTAPANVQLVSSPDVDTLYVLDASRGTVTALAY